MSKRILCAVLTALFLLCAAAEGERRMLCVSVSRYDDGRERIGGVNSARGVYDALSRAFPDSGYTGTLLTDPDRAELEAALSALSEAGSEEDTVVIYLNAHGGSAGGVSWLETREGTRMTARELEAFTRRIPGKVILLLDFCASGGLIGRETAGETEGLDPFASDKYRVLTSCTAEENSYRVARDYVTEEYLATAFARSFCEGMGWDLIADVPGPLKADIDKTRTVSFDEIYLYTRGRCRYYLSGSGHVQTVCIGGAPDGLIMAARK